MPQSHKLEGFVFNAAGNPQADRVVRAYRRDYGTLIGEALTGDGNVVPADEHYNNVSLLLKFDGLNNDTSVLDLSPTPKTVTFNGNAKLSNVEKKFGETSLYLDGIGDYLELAASSAWDLGTAWTIEFWYYPTLANHQGKVISTRTGSSSGYEIALYNSGSGIKLGVEGWGANTTSGAKWSTAAIPANQWSHLAVVFNGSSLFLIINGQVDSVYANSTSWSSGGQVLRIGLPIPYTEPCQGYLDDLRITKGVARYGFFEVPTTEILETKPMFEDLLGSNCYSATANLSDVQKKWGNRSLTGFVSIPPTTFSDDFTLEAWVYYTSFASWDSLFGFDDEATNRLAIGFKNGIPSYDIYGGGLEPNFGTTALQLNQWQHVAFVRKGTSFSAFINGILVGTNTQSGTLGNAVSAVCGCAGYGQDFRITKGFARYISNFTPPRNSYFDTVTLTDPYDANVVLDLPLDVPEDPFWNHVVLAMSMDGANNGTSFKDIKANPQTIVGSPLTKTGIKKFGNSSLYFSGANNYININNSELFNFSATPIFTIECWIYLTANITNYAGIVSKSNNSASTDSFALIFNASNQILFLTSDGSTNRYYAVATSGAVTLNQWHHISVSVNLPAKTVVTSFNGQVISAVARSSTINASTHPVSIGYYAGHNFTGYIDDLRITKGVARYSSNFTPPTKSHFAIEDKKGKTVTKNNDVELTITNPKFGNGCVYFNGVGDSLEIGNPTDWKKLHNGSSFTAESWINPVATGNAMSIISTAASGAYNGFIAQILGNDSYKVSIQIYRTDFSNVLAWKSTTGVSTGVWSHVAITFNGTTPEFFVNGNKLTLVSEHIGSSWPGFSNLDPTFTLAVGRYQHPTPGNYFTGYLQDLRITYDVVKYSTNFTPPTKSYNYNPTDYFDEYNILKMPLQELPIANGDPYESNVVFNMPLKGRPDNGDPYRNSVVLNMRMEGFPGVKTFKDDCGKQITLSGDSQISNAKKKYGTTSALFDGSGDYFTVPSSTDFDFGLGDYTIEFWVNVTAIGATYQTLISRYSAWATSVAFYMEIQPNGTVRYRAGNSVPIVVISTSTLQIGTWNHIAVTCSSGTTRLFINGIVESSTGVTASISSGSALAFGYELTGGSGYFNGYLDDLRITKGVARYTANFTPPVQIPKITQPLVIKDDKSNPITVNGDVRLVTSQTIVGGVGSLYFDGSGDSITTQGISSLSLGATYTIEFWEFQSVAANADLVTLTDVNTGSFGQLEIGVTSAGAVYFNSRPTTGGTYVAGTSSNGVAAFGSWHHIAMSRDETSLRVFVDGILVLFSTAGALYVPSPILGIGARGNGYSPAYFTGYIDDLRITKGVARYSGNFTPPAQTLPETLNGGNALGKFTIPTNFTGETYVVVLPDATEVTNAKIKDRIVPVAV